MQKISLSMVSLLTGICEQTVRKHAKEGWFRTDYDGKHLNTSFAFMIDYAIDEWNRGLCLMYPPECIERRYRDLLRAPRSRGNNKKERL